MPTTIAVIGGGNIGGTLAAAWCRTGRRVLMGLRDPAGPRATEAKAIAGDALSVVSLREAAEAADVVVFAVPGRAMADVLEDLGGALAGKTVIDATNTIGPAGPSGSLDRIATIAPTSVAYRAFNSLGWENFAEPRFDGVAADLFFAGPNGPRRELVEGLIADVGLRPIWLGGPDRAGLVDAVAAIWFALVMGQGKSRHLAFKVLGI